MNGRQFDCGICMTDYLATSDSLFACHQLGHKKVDVDVDVDIDIDNTICTFSEQLIQFIVVISSKRIRYTCCVLLFSSRLFFFLNTYYVFFPVGSIL